MKKDPAFDAASDGSARVAASSPLSLLREAIVAVPSVKYALGVVGIAAALSIVLGLISDVRIAAIGVPLSVFFMVILLVFQKLSVLENDHFKYPALMLVWVFPALLVAFLCLLFSSVFFNWPLSLKRWLEGQQAVVNQVTSSTVPSFTIVPVTSGTPYQADHLKTMPDPMRSHALDKNQTQRDLERVFGPATYSNGVMIVGARAQKNDRISNEATRQVLSTLNARLREKGLVVDEFRLAVYSEGHFDAILNGGASLLVEAGLDQRMRAAFLAGVEADCRPAVTISDAISCTTSLQIRFVSAAGRTSVRRLSETGPGPNIEHSLARSIELLFDRHPELLDGE